MEVRHHPRTLLLRLQQHCDVVIPQVRWEEASAVPLSLLSDTQAEARTWVDAISPSQRVSIGPDKLLCLVKSL